MTVCKIMKTTGEGFGAWVRAAREKRGLTQTDLATLSGLSRGMVARVETGTVGFTERTVDSIAEALAPENADKFTQDRFRADARRAAYGVQSAPILSRFGSEVDASPYLYALTNVQTATAGIVRLPDASAPGEDLTPGGKVKAIRVTGDCMEPLLKDGDIALVIEGERVVDGNAVFAIVDGAVTVCKRARIVDGASWLESADGSRIEEPRFIIAGVIVHKITTI